jgi:pimeloyl-ACP methyl ester carboxylesterase
MIFKQPKDKISIAVDTLYPIEWLKAQADGDPQGRTNRQVQIAVSTSNLSVKSYNLSVMQEMSDRVLVTRPQTLVGALSQMCAALTHHVSTARLRRISSSVPKIIIVTGDEDHLVPCHKSHNIKTHMPEAELVQIAATGHGLVMQRADELNALLKRNIQEAREIVRKKTPYLIPQ